jgi:hypothetical protein
MLDPTLSASSSWLMSRSRRTFAIRGVNHMRGDASGGDLEPAAVPVSRLGAAAARLREAHERRQREYARRYAAVILAQLCAAKRALLS